MNVINSNTRGFNLIEVNLAIFLVAGGLLMLFSLFPLGLRQSQAAIEDCQEAMFADYVLGCIEGLAMAETDHDAWVAGNFLVGMPDGIRLQQGNNDPIIWPASPAESEPATYLQYSLGVTNAAQNGLVKSVVLTVRSGRYGKIDKFSRTYMTQVAYLGM